MRKREGSGSGSGRPKDLVLDTDLQHCDNFNFFSLNCSDLVLIFKPEFFLRILIRLTQKPNWYDPDLGPQHLLHTLQNFCSLSAENIGSNNQCWTGTVGTVTWIKWNHKGSHRHSVKLCIWFPSLNISFIHISKKNCENCFLWSRYLAGTGTVTCQKSEPEQ